MDAQRVRHIISQGESETIEFKKNFNRQTIETLVAFANTKGGKVLLGVSDNGKIIGINTSPESIQNWINEIKNKTSPQIVPDAEHIEAENKNIVIFSVQEYPVKPLATQGKYYKRIANSNHLIEITELVNMLLQSFNTSWDYYTNNEFNMSDISLEKVQNSIDIYSQNRSAIDDHPLTFLLKNALLRNEKLTNAAYLLFTEGDTVLTTIELGRFQTNTIIKDSLRSKSDILSQIDFVIDFVKKHINKEIIITGEARNTQKWQYPLEAIREIVINMIIHRDYRASSDSIVKIFDNYIEFYNPGKLPDEISIDDLLNNNYKSTPRNKLIADFCKNTALIEKYGSGIQSVIKYFKNANIPVPEFKNFRRIYGNCLCRAC